MSSNVNDKFSFFVPATIEKGKKDGVDEMKIKGVCSSVSEDSDGETLLPVGFDYSPLLTKGFLNWDHQAKKRPSAIIGEPTVAKIINGGKDFYIEGVLYNDSEDAQDVYKLAKVLEKNSKTRRLGFSIEGQAIERGCGPKFLDKEETIQNPSFDQALWNKITKARITGVAITPCPKNPNTLMQLMKGEYSTALMDNEYDEEIEKAMDAIGAEGITQTESVEGFKKKKKKDTELTDSEEEEKDDQVAKVIKKSEVYNLIAENYTTNPVIAKQIYSLIEATNQKLYNMSTITREAVDAAFGFLNKAEENLLNKSNTETQVGNSATSTEITKSEDADNLEKAKEMCKGFLEKGMKRDECIDELQKSGYSEPTAVSAADACITEANAKKDGGDITQVTPTVTKGEETPELAGTLKEGPDFSGLIKGLSDELKGHSDKKFSALGTLLQFQAEQLDVVKSQNDELGKRLEKMESASQGRKSVTTTANPVERFEKSEAANATEELNGKEVFDLSKGADVTAFGERLFAEAMVARNANRPDALLEKAVADFEISKSIPSQILPFLATKNIVVRNATPGRK